MLSAIITSGCGTENALPVKPTADAIRIDEVEWSVSEAIVDGERKPVFTYTNNSKYTIVDIKLKFALKEDVTPEQLSVFDEYKTLYKKTDEDIAKTFVQGFNYRFSDPGETLENSPLDLNGTFVEASMEQYLLTEPDILTVAYIGKDGKMYGIYYDFKSESYSKVSEEGKSLDEWSESELCQKLPKPASKHIMINYDNENSFGFTTYDNSKEVFEKYVQAVKEKGFTQVDSSIDQGESWYRAKNAEGDRVSVQYYIDASNDKLVVYINKAE